MNLLERLQALIDEMKGDGEAVPAVFSEEGESPVVFAAPSGERVRWTGPLFRTGDYGRKGKYTPDEIRGFVSTFPPEGVTVKDTHVPEDVPLVFHELLKASGTRVARVWATDDGHRLDGEFDAPKWLHEAFQQANLTKKVSIGLTDDRKALNEVSLVLKPHVKDAAVFHHDLATAFSHSPDFAAADEETRAAVLALAPEAEKPAPAPARTEGSNTSMNFAEKSKAGLSLLTPEQRASVGLTDSELANPANFSAPEPTKTDPRDIAMARTLGKAAASGLTHEGFAFNQDAFLRRYVDACKQDGGGSVTFSDDGDVTTGDAVKDVIALVKDSQKVKLGGQVIPGAPATFSDDSKAISDQERFQATLEGRAPQEGK